MGHVDYRSWVINDFPVCYPLHLMLYGSNLGEEIRVIRL